MNSFVGTVFLSLCVFQLGHAEEREDALKAIQDLKAEVLTLNDKYLTDALSYGNGVSDQVEAADNEYLEQFNQQIRPVLDEIEKTVSKYKGPYLPPIHCYKEARLTFNKLNVTSHKAVEYCSVYEKDGVDPDGVFDSLLTLLKGGKSLADYAGKVEKEIENSSDSEIQSFEKNQIPAIRSTLALYKAAVAKELELGEKAIKESGEHARKCNEKYLADVPAAVKEIRGSALKCVEQY